MARLYVAPFVFHIFMRLTGAISKLSFVSEIKAMKQIIQRIAFFSFLGCLTLVGIASSKSNPHMKCHEEWKQGLVSQVEDGEPIVVKHVHDNSYEIHPAGNIYNHIDN